MSFDTYNFLVRPERFFDKKNIHNSLIYLKSYVLNDCKSQVFCEEECHTHTPINFLNL